MNRYTMQMDKKAFNILIIFIVAFLIFKLLFLYFNMIFLYSCDEAQRMKLAADILIFKKSFSSIVSNITDYQFSYYRGGSLIVSILYIPLAYLLGINTFSLKLVALIFSLGTFITWYIFLTKAFNNTVAILFGILFISGPPIFHTCSLMLPGSYLESGFFVILGLFLLWNLSKKKDIGLSKSYPPSFIFGLLCGFSLYFDYAFLIAIVTFLFLWLIIDSKFYIKKYFLVFILGFLLGFSPWILTHLAGNLSNLIRGHSVREIFFSRNISYMFKDLKYAVINVPILSPCYKNDYIFSGFPLMIKETARYLYRGAFLVSFFSLTPRIFRDKNLTIPLGGILLYTTIFILVYSMAIPQFHLPRHSVPLYPFVFAIIGIATGLFLKSRVNTFLKMAGISLFSIIAMSSLIDNFNHIAFKYVRNPFEFKGYEYGYLLKWDLLMDAHIDDLDRYIAFKKRNNQTLQPLMNYFPYKYQEEYQKEIGGRMDLHWTEGAEAFVKRNLVEVLNEQLAGGYSHIQDWGWALGIIYRWDIEKCVRIIRQLKLPQADERNIIYYSLGLGIGSLAEKDREKAMQETLKFNADIQYFIRKGINDFK